MIKYPCFICDKESIFITADGKDVCRWCHPPHNDEMRAALNNIQKAGMIYKGE